MIDDLCSLMSDVYGMLNMNGYEIDGTGIIQLTWTHCRLDG